MSFKNDLSKTTKEAGCLKIDNGLHVTFFSYKIYKNTNCVSSCKGKVNRYYKITITYTHFLEINAS